MKTIKKIEVNRVLNFKALEKELGRAKLADKINRSYNLVTQYLSGQKKLGEELARDIEESLSKPTYWLDKNHKKEVNSSLDHVHPVARIPHLSLDSLTPSGDKINSEESYMLYLTEIQKTKIQSKVSKIENLTALEIEDDTMRPFLFPGCTVLIDKGRKEPVDGKRYAVRIGSKIVIRRIYIERNQINITCDTEDAKIKKENRDLNVLISELGGEIDLIGRLVYVQSELED